MQAGQSAGAAHWGLPRRCRRLTGRFELHRVNLKNPPWLGAGMEVAASDFPDEDPDVTS